MLTSSTRSLLVTTYRGEQRARAISLFTATLTAGLGVGLVLGGVITSALGWRWCLYLNLVFSAFAVLGAPRVLPPSPRRADVHIDLLSVVLASIVVEGIGTGLAGPVTLNLALRGVLAADSGAAGAATSAAGQLGSSVGAALFNTIAATVVAGYLRAHPGGSVLAGTVHGFDVAMAWGVAVMVAAAIPVARFVNAPAPAPRSR